MSTSTLPSTLTDTLPEACAGRATRSGTACLLAEGEKEFVRHTGADPLRNIKTKGGCRGLGNLGTGELEGISGGVNFVPEFGPTLYSYRGFPTGQQRGVKFDVC